MAAGTACAYPGLERGTAEVSSDCEDEDEEPWPVGGCDVSEDELDDVAWTGDEVWTEDVWAHRLTANADKPMESPSIREVKRTARIYRMATFQDTFSDKTNFSPCIHPRPGSNRTGHSRGNQPHSL